MQRASASRYRAKKLCQPYRPYGTASLTSATATTMPPRIPSSRAPFAIAASISYRCGHPVTPKNLRFVAIRVSTCRSGHPSERAAEVGGTARLWLFVSGDEQRETTRLHLLPLPIDASLYREPVKKCADDTEATPPRSCTRTTDDGR